VAGGGCLCLLSVGFVGKYLGCHVVVKLIRKTANDSTNKNRRKTIIEFQYLYWMSPLFDIKTSLTARKSDLVRKYHISSMGLFGSVVRDDFTPSSDIDIIVSFSRPIGIEFIDLADELEKMLHRKVDLVSRGGVKEKYFKAIETDIIYV
jgi:predicted nucleotidyltransferase